jgi:hypothetical protein
MVDLKGSKKLFSVMLLLVGIGILGCREQPEKAAAPAKAKPQEAQTGKIRDISIAPDKPTPMTSLVAKVFFRGHEPKRVTYQWLRNGTPIPGAIRPLLPTGHLHKGDFIAVEVRAIYLDGSTDRSVSKVVIIGNTPPVVKWVSIKPNPATSSDVLQAGVGTTDRDGDQLSLTYEWTVDGETLFGQAGPSLPSRYIHRGNQVQVAATAFDGTDEGNTRRSEPLVILNSAPKIVSAPPERAAAGVYRYAVRAVDSDGDPLRFSLGGQPPVGMEINRKTGVVQWQVVLPEKEVIYSYEVVAEDPAGAKSIQKVTMNATPAGGQP